MFISPVKMLCIFAGWDKPKDVYKRQPKGLDDYDGQDSSGNAAN